MSAAETLILNIDDQPAIRYAKTRALLRAGFKVIEASSGTEGLECAETHRPALVLCDVKMPDMSGLDVARTIKQRHPGMLVLQVSASFVTGQDRAAGLEVGADSYLTEPVEPDELVASVRALLRMKKAETDLRAEQERREFVFNLAQHQRTLDAPRDVVRFTAEALAKRMGANRAGFYRVAPDGQISVIETWSDGTLADLPQVFAAQDFGLRIRTDFESGRTVVLENAADDSRSAGTAIPTRAAAAISVPVLRRGRWEASMFVNSAEPRRWKAEEIGLLEEVAPLTWDAVERAQAAQDLRELNASLEKQVAQRTREVMEYEAQLRQSQKMEAVGQLTGGIAHDFNNLLTGIIGGVDIIRRRIAKGDLHGVDPVMDAVAQSAERAASLTQRLLAFSRRQSLDFKPVDINAMIRSVAELLRRTLGENIDLRITEANGLWPAFTDASQLDTALLNLVINARDAMPDGGRLTVETANADFRDATAARLAGLDAGEYVMVAVSDTGIGMTQDVIDKVFDPFFTTKPLGQGTGLGLSMVYGFIKQSRGHVAIESEVGKGTTLRLYLPRSLAAEEADAETLPKVERPARAGEVVLLAEDDPGVRLLVTEVLKDLGYRALIAADGTAAVEILNSNERIDLLVTDVGLPGVNGRQVAEVGRQTRPDLPVLFITGYAEAAAVRSSFLGRGMDLIAKPFDLNKLASKVREIIET